MQFSIELKIRDSFGGKNKALKEMTNQIASLSHHKYGGQSIIQEDFNLQRHLKYATSLCKLC